MPDVERTDLLDPRELALDQPLTEIRVGLDRPHRGRDEWGFLASQQDTRPTHRLGDRRGAEGDDRDPGRHRLENRDPETLVLTHRDEDPGTCEGKSQLAVGYLAEQGDPILDTTTRCLRAHGSYVFLI